MNSISSIPSLDFGGSGAELVFLHANGYPPASYRPLLSNLAQTQRVTAMLLRPLWENSRSEELHDWHPLSTDLTRFLSDQRFDSVIGVGHSVGGIVALRSALRNPEKFRALILLDPVLFVPLYLVGWNVMRGLGLGNKLHPLIASAQRRRKTFENLEMIFQNYRRKSIFKYISDENLRVYIEGLVKQTADGKYELIYSPEWEARIYLTGLRDFDLWRALKKLKVPTLIIRGAETDTFMANAANLVQKKNPHIHITTLVKTTHLLPLEKPAEVAALINDFIQKSAAG